MAEGGPPASELFPTGGATVPLDGALSADPLLPLSKSSVDVLTAPRHQEEPKTSSDRQTSFLQRDNAGRSQVDSQKSPADPRCTTQHPADPVPPRTSARPHSIAEANASQRLGGVANHSLQVDRGMMLSVCREGLAVSSTSQRDLRWDRLGPGPLPVQRSHSDILHLVREAGGPSPPGYPGRDTPQEALLQAHPMLACKQAMQLQHCNAVTTTCRGGNSGGGSPKPQPPGGCVRMCSSGPSNPTSEVCGNAPHHHPHCEEGMCHGAFVHHGTLEDTFAAYCHPQPIPAPTQQAPRQAGVDSDYRDARLMAGHPAANLLALPRLISSVSETGLDAKRMLRCCKLNCTWVRPLPPGGGGPPQGEEYGGCSTRAATRETGTMTACKELRDAGVQTVHAPEPPPPHVFPQVCLVEDSPNRAENANGVAEVASGGQKTPVKEVKWDAEGMTWEVYGASVDPEELGLAIQRHLELQIKETAGRAAKLSRQDTITSCKSSNDTGRRRKRAGVMASIRSPACCARSSTAVD
ncbi:uncharacterized protein si:dkey-191g9.7 isoform X2 [Osmerus mordax]